MTSEALFRYVMYLPPTKDETFRLETVKHTLRALDIVQRASAMIWVGHKSPPAVHSHFGLL